MHRKNALSIIKNISTDKYFVFVLIWNDRTTSKVALSLRLDMSCIDYGNLVCKKNKIDEVLDIFFTIVDNWNLNTVVVTFVIVYLND